MGNDERPELEGQLKRGIDALRNTAGTIEGPTEELMRRTIEKARSAARDEGSLSLRRSWQMKMVRRFSVAAGLGVLLAGGSLWLLSGGGDGARIAFADVLEQVKQMQAVRCHVEVDLGNVAPGKTLSEEMLMVDPGWEVMEGGMQTMDGKGMPGQGDVRVIMNSVQGKVLMLMGGGKGESRQAILMDLTNMPPEERHPNLLDQFKNVNGKESKSLGEKEMEGVKTKGFEVTKNDTTMEVWADEKTERPVLAVMKMTNPVMGWTMRYTFSQFDWQPAYDASELTLEVPAGYTLAKTQVDASEPKEADIVGMLRMMTELNDGEFPAGLGMKDLVPVLEKWEKAQGTGKRNATMSAGAMDKLMVVGRGWSYISHTTHGAEWHYAGAGVAAGEKGRVVLWYKPAGGTGWRAFDADFTAHDVKESDLPADGEPVKLELPAPAIVK